MPLRGSELIRGGQEQESLAPTIGGFPINTDCLLEWSGIP